MLSDQPRLLQVTSTVLLSTWGRQLLKDMMSLGTDFETHAIWQGYVEDPAAKVFLARNARTIALCEAHINQPNSRIGNPLGIPSRAVLRSLAGLMSREEVLVQGFLQVRKV